MGESIPRDESASSPKPPVRQGYPLLRGLDRRLSGSAFLLPFSAFPVPEDELRRARRLVQELSGAVVRQWGLSFEVFLQVAQLHLGDGAARFSSHGAEWGPEIGLGVWPDREPPTTWTEADFVNLGPAEKPRRLMHQVFRIGAAHAKEHARDLMLGVGTVLQIMTKDETEKLLGKARELLFPPIKDPSLRAFPYYVPLLDCNSVTSPASSHQIETWLCGAAVYIRESFEDTGMLIASLPPLAPILEQLGGRAGAGGLEWYFDY